MKSHSPWSLETLIYLPEDTRTSICRSNLTLSSIWCSSSSSLPLLSNKRILMISSPKTSKSNSSGIWRKCHLFKFRECSITSSQERILCSTVKKCMVQRSHQQVMQILCFISLHNTALSALNALTLFQRCQRKTLLWCHSCPTQL